MLNSRTRFLNVLILFIAAIARGQCPQWLPPLFPDTPVGADGNIFDAVSYTSPQGTGPWTIVAGEFTHVGGRDIPYLAAWDGTTWRDIGASRALSALNGRVTTVAVFNGRLIAGGDFTQAGSDAAAHIAQWTGYVWQAMSTGLYSTDAAPVSVNALRVFNNELYVGGHFHVAGGVVSHIAKWNGSGWSSPGTGVEYASTSQPTIGNVSDLDVYNGELIACGIFNRVNGQTIGGIARWNGSLWNTMGSSPFSTNVERICISGGFLYAGSGALYRYDGSSWTTVASMSGSSWFRGLAPLPGGVVVGGRFTPNANTSIQNLGFCTHGGVWTGMTPSYNYGFNDFITCVVSLNGPLIIGVPFTVASNEQVFNHIAGTSGTVLTPIQEVASSVHALTNQGGKIYAGGSFVIPGSPDVHNVAVWDGTSYGPMGSGTNGTIYALKGYLSGNIPLQRNNIVAAGSFTTAGGVAVNNIAIWTDEPFVQTNWSAMGSGFNNTVYALERFSNSLYAAGAFTLSGATSVSRIARWNGSGWVAVGTGLNGTASALKVYNGQLYAGGGFTTAGGVTTGGLARYNGSTWSNVGGTFSGTVLAMEVFNNELIVAGTFPGVTGAPNITRWNGTSYNTLTFTGPDATVRALAVNGSKLYVGGDFNISGGGSVNSPHIATWNATNFWEPIGSGIENSVYALASFQNEVHVGAFPNGGIHYPAWRRYSTDGLPTIIRQPFLSVSCGQRNASCSVQVAADGHPTTYTWKKNGQILSLGPTGTGSIIASLNETFNILNIGTADSGQYTVTVYNSCGNTISAPTSMTICSADFNCDGAVDFFDYLDFVDAFSSNTSSADFNHDNAIDFFDYLDFVDAFSAGC